MPPRAGVPTVPRQLRVRPRGRPGLVTGKPGRAGVGRSACGLTESGSESVSVAGPGAMLDHHRMFKFKLLMMSETRLLDCQAHRDCHTAAAAEV